MNMHKGTGCTVHAAGELSNVNSGALLAPVQSKRMQINKKGCDKACITLTRVSRNSKKCRADKVGSSKNISEQNTERKRDAVITSSGDERHG